MSNIDMQTKIIHYCWFGKTKLQNINNKCIQSWKKYLPDWKIIRWDENNIKIWKCPKYVKNAYKNKMWAFVSDYIRLKVINKYGGLYMDTDLELIKDPSFLFESSLVLGFESNSLINAAIFYSSANNLYLKELLNYYNSIDFIDKKTNQFQTIPEIIAKILSVRFNIKLNGELQKRENLIVLPSDYFYPYNPYQKDQEKGLTKNSVSIHHYSASWHNVQITHKNKNYFNSFCNLLKNKIHFYFKKVRNIF